MINLAISIAVLLFLALVPKFTLDVSFWLTIPFGLIAGVATFFVLYLTQAHGWSLIDAGLIYALVQGGGIGRGGCWGQRLG